MSSFARAVVKKYQDREPKQQKLIAWQFQRLQVQVQGGSRVGSSEGCEGRAQRSQSHALCQLLRVYWQFQCSSTCRCLTPISAFSFRWRHFSSGLSAQISPSYKVISHIRLGAHPTPVWPHFNYLNVQQCNFGIRSEILRMRTFTSILGSCNWTHTHI